MNDQTTNRHSRRISEAEKLAVEAAITRAEKLSSAEIYAVLAERSDDYRFVAYSFLGFWIFIFSVLYAVFVEWRFFADVAGDWQNPGIQVSAILWAQLLAFLTGVVLFRLFPNLAAMVVPERIAHERAHANAVKLFLAHGIHNTKNRTGVLVFVSLQERFGEIIVDQAIEAKIGRHYFLQQVELLIESCAKENVGEGFEITITALGKKLAEDFPRRKNDRNEIADKLIVM